MIFIDSFVISEYLNKFVAQPRNRESKKLKKSIDRKEFRKHAVFKEVISNANDSIQKILSKAEYIFDGYSSDINSLVEGFTSRNCEFNDLVIEELCLRHNFIFVTNDADFKDSSLPIVTCNQKLL